VRQHRSRLFAGGKFGEIAVATKGQRPDDALPYWHPLA
jgi:hypothetical protein